jgi:DNA-binding transcriptional regulator GbsR (MarR family)
MYLTPEQKSLVEKMGVFQERFGKSPVESRVAALLLVADQSEMTFDEIRVELNVSKSAASNALSMLLKTNKVEYITRQGDRKRYFRSNLHSWEHFADENLQALAVMREILKEILDQRTPDTIEFNNTLSDVIGFMEFAQVEMLNIFKKWKERK